MIRENMISQKRLTKLGLFRQENTTDVREDTSLKRHKGYHEKEVINCSPCPLQIRIRDRTVSNVILFQRGSFRLDIRKEKPLKPLF